LVHSVGHIGSHPAPFSVDRNLLPGDISSLHILVSVVYPVLPQSRGFCFVEFVSQYTACLASRDVPNRFFILVRILKKLGFGSE